MSTIRIGMVNMVTRERREDDAPGTLYASNLTREGTVERGILRSVCASITVAQAGKVRWARVGESSGSGIERTEGAWDSRPITKAWLNDAGKGTLYLFVTLDPTAGKGTGMRRIRIDSLIPASVGTAIA
jgi:hypothetical protein